MADTLHNIQLGLAPEVANPYRAAVGSNSTGIIDLEGALATFKKAGDNEEITITRKRDVSIFPCWYSGGSAGGVAVSCRAPPLRLR